MRIGVPKEVKIEEYRVSVIPSNVKEIILSNPNHEVLVQKNAGVGAGFSDQDYINAGAKIVNSAKEAFDVDMVIKVKEIQPQEFEYLKEGQIIFSYLHLAPDLIQTKALLDKKVIGIAYETVEENNVLPLLANMSEIAGRLAIQQGSRFLNKLEGSKGILLEGAVGTLPAKVFVIGGGVVGLNSARSAMNCGADVFILDNNLERLRYIDEVFNHKIKTLYSNQTNLEYALINGDMVIFSVLIPGRSAPHLVTRKMLSLMQKGSVIVDVSIDQGGCLETSRATNHKDPVYIEEGIIHYCVGNMPGIVPKTASLSLSNTTIRYILKLANQGEKILSSNTQLQTGLNVYKGFCLNKAVSESLNLEYTSVEKLIEWGKI